MRGGDISEITFMKSDLFHLYSIKIIKYDRMDKDFP